VTKRIFPFEAPVDPGLAEWARAYLNEQLTGMRLGTRMLNQRLVDPGLSPRELAFLDVLRPAFTELVDADQEHRLYIGGASRLVSEMRLGDVAQIDALMRLLEERAVLLGMLRGALDSKRLYLRIGSELEMPQVRGLSLVAANYGLPARNLGTVSLIGPTRMDYATAIRAVRAAARVLSEFVEEVYEE
jgi:heat-inducible transcriptional repressor